MAAATAAIAERCVRFATCADAMVAGGSPVDKELLRLRAPSMPAEAHIRQTLWRRLELNFNASLWLFRLALDTFKPGLELALALEVLLCQLHSDPVRTTHF